LTDEQAGRIVESVESAVPVTMVILSWEMMNIMRVLIFTMATVWWLSDFLPEAMKAEGLASLRRSAPMNFRRLATLRPRWARWAR
jgi:hypothetical protein